MLTASVGGASFSSSRSESEMSSISFIRELELLFIKRFLGAAGVEVGAAEAGAIPRFELAKSPSRGSCGLPLL